MKLDSIERFEIVAAAFYIQTGFMRPGKDIAAAMGVGYSDEERSAAFDAWINANREVVNAMLLGFERVIQREEDDA
ncbi:MAG: hypothetical protein EBR82_09710 [Caulobacteraceae bacterium]|nr:hypothetical protein [Caulobacteraceae bacterium]